MDTKRFRFKGTEKQLPNVEAAIKERKITREDMYLILKYFEISPGCEDVLKQQFPDV